MKKLNLLCLSGLLFSSTLFIFNMNNNNVKAAEVVNKPKVGINSINNKSNYRKNSYNLIWSKKIDKQPLEIINAPYLYSQNLYESFKPSLALENYENIYAISKFKFYNKINHKYYIFYGISNEQNGTKPIYLVRDKWIAFINQSNKNTLNRQIINVFKGYSTNNTIQQIANLYVSYFDTSKYPSLQKTAFDDQVSNIINNNNLRYFEIDKNKDFYSKTLFKKLISRKISFKNYSKLIFNHQVGNLYKFGKNKQIGVYVYPKESFKYGNIIFVLK